MIELENGGHWAKSLGAMSSNIEDACIRKRLNDLVLIYSIINPVYSV
jgi:hypothetical protein